MIERDQTQPESVEVVKQEFRTHLLSVEFGSPDYLAFCDFYDLEDQMYLHKIEIGQLKDKTTIEDGLLKQSQLRITENRIALIEHDIERQKVRDIAYAKAFSHVEETMGKLRTAITLDEREESSDGSVINEISEGSYHDILVNDFRDVLYRFYK